MTKLESPRPPFSRIPEELKQLDQWVNWRLDQDAKVPVNPRTLGNAGVNWSDTWSGFAAAREVAIQRDLGLGFVLTEHDPYTCVDLDNCVGPRGGVDARTRDILDLLGGWVELSPSGRGLHIWVRNERPLSRRTKTLEVYSYGRWMSVTGRSNPRAPLVIPERTEAVETLVDRYLPKPEPPVAAPSQPVPLNDTEIWQRLFHGESADLYTRLYDGDLSACGGDHSLGVILLANQLAWMTDYDPGRMKQLLYQTGLVQKKWQEARGAISWIDYQIRDAIAYMSGRQT